MKKTLIALMALAGVAVGADMSWTGSGYLLSDMTTITSQTIQNTNGWIITKTGDDTSPAPVALSLTFTLTSNPVSCNQHFLSFGADQGGSQNAYGFIVTTDGALEFGYMGTDNLTKSDGTNITTSKGATFDAITLNQKYELHLVSYASGTTPGRGSDNFSITLINTTTGISETKSATGFGLNGSSFANLRIGSNLANDENVLKGTIESIKLSAPIPEPTTATLSLLALCGLAARRRRK